MADPLINFLRPGFPKEFATSGGYETLLEYVGPQDEIYGVVNLGESWGDYQGVVEDAKGEPIEGTEYAILSVRMLRKFSPGDPGAPSQVEMETNYELDWLAVPRPLIQHRVFQKDGLYELSNQDITQIQKWEEMPNATFKSEFKFFNGSYEDWSGTATDLDTLSEPAQYYAQGILLGVENFVEFAPVIKKNTTYKNGLPPNTGAGEKEEPDFGDEIPPAGYEFVKNADTSAMTGKQNEWQRSQEWLGSNKVLADSKSTYWELPA